MQRNSAVRLGLCALLLLLAVVAPAAEFPTPYDSEPDAGDGPMPPEQVVREMKLPPGFRATVFAAEPDVCNPIAMAWDAKGRLWVAENYTYAEAPLKFETKLRDRILIFSDVDGDGHFDERKVFADDLQMLTGLEVGLGGVWVICPPQMSFLPDADGDDRPDGPAQVVLDGFRVPPENYHNFANGLRFGPDGWLYGRCGASAPGEVGKPGTRDDERIPVRGGMWRYSPKTEVFESLTSGTTNPWGHDWNKFGELFFVNTVNGHLWHAVPGMHFTRPHTIDPNPRVYELIDTHADHWHFDVDGGWQNSRDGAANELGGGHAHIGCCIYNDNAWPEKYRDRLYTLNMHGRRINCERLDREGSGYVGRHEPDFLVVSDPFFRGMELSIGPDGGMFVADWSDTGECHERTGVHRSSGRIYKITYDYADRDPVVDLTQLTNEELVDRMKGTEWYARQARLLLRARAPQRPFNVPIHELSELCASSDPVTALRGLWACHSCEEPYVAEQVFQSEETPSPVAQNEHLRAWFLRLAFDQALLDTPLGTVSSPYSSEWPVDHGMVERAARETSPLVRLVTASALQRMKPTSRIDVAAALMSHAEDADDHNLPLLIWYGLIPAIDAVPREFAQLARDCKLPTTRRLIARRLAETYEKDEEPFVDMLDFIAPSDDDALVADIVAGVAAALKGRHKARPTKAWERFAVRAAMIDDEQVQAQVRDLNVLFGDGRALDAVREIVLDGDASIDQRRAALSTLIDVRPPDLRKVCERAIKVRFLNPTAARGLALFDDDAAAATLVGAYKSFHHSERAQLIGTLASRPRFARAMLTAVVAGAIPRTDLTAFVARQIHEFGDDELDELLRETWGEFRDSPAEKKELMAKLKVDLARYGGDAREGRALFVKTCAACHKLFGEGQTVGPDLTGANRENLDYLLENIVDPSAVVSADFRMSVLVLADGRVLNGLVLAENDATLTLRTATESVTLDRGDIEERRTVPLSLMPENQLQTMTPQQVRDLFAYLKSRYQVPLQN